MEALEGFKQEFEVIKKQIMSGDVGTLLARFSDILLVGVIMSIIGMMIVPLPPFLLIFCSP